MAGFKYSVNLYEETRYRRIIEFIEEFCNPHDKVIVDLCAGNNPISKYIPCKKVIKRDFSSTKDPSPLCNLNHGVPLCDNVCDYRFLWVLGKVPPYAAKAEFTYLPHGQGVM